MMIHQKKQALLALGVGLVGVVLALCIVFFSPGKPADPPQAHAESRTVQAAAGAEAPAEQVVIDGTRMAAAGIDVATAGPAAIGSVTTLTGDIRANEDRKAHVVPRVAGVVESVHADLGQAVRKGQLLAVLASVALSEQRSELLTARERLALARTSAEREKKLWEDKISAQQDYLQAIQGLREAEIVRRNAEQKLRALGASTQSAGALNRYELRAPFDGVVIEKHLTLGESVREDANVLTIADLSSVWAEIAVPPGALASVRVGAHATVRAELAGADGTVSYVGAVVGEQTRTATARVVLANGASAWRPGQSVTVDIASDPADVPVAVPADAIQTVEGKPTLFVRTASGFAARHVATGKTDGKRTEIREGLAAGSVYAATGSFVLKAELGKSGAGESH
jgi:cobalt-zinc-cadmium efflux system membrane fusion protein